MSARRSVSLILLLFLFGIFSNAIQIPLSTNDVETPDQKTRVPVTLGVMSRCPDALLCESVLDGVFKKTWDLVDVNLTFIAQIDPTEPQFGVRCKHGPEECLGNIHELCAMNLAATQQDWWEFVQCANFEGKDHVGEEDLSRKCADVAGIPWEDVVEEPEAGMNSTIQRPGLRNCIEDRKQGLTLLKQSAKETARLGITKSCSIYITGKIRCIHDSDWQDCETGHSEDEFIKFIQSEYTRLNP